MIIHCIIVLLTIITIQSRGQLFDSSSPLKKGLQKFKKKKKKLKKKKKIKTGQGLQKKIIRKEHLNVTKIYRNKKVHKNTNTIIYIMLSMSLDCVNPSVELPERVFSGVPPAECGPPEPAPPTSPDPLGV